MQTRHRVLGDASWTRGKVSKGLNAARDKPMSMDSSTQLEHAWHLRGKWRRRPFSSPHACSLSAFRPRKVDGTRAEDPRCAPAGFSQGPAYKSRPGLFTRQGQIEVLGSAGWVRGRGGTAGQNHSSTKSIARLDVQAASPTAKMADSTCRQFLLLPNGRLGALTFPLASRPTAVSPFSFTSFSRPLHLSERWAESPSERGTKKKNLLVHHHCTNNKQPLTPPDTHVTSIYRTTWLNMHLMGDLG